MCQSHKRNKHLCITFFSVVYPAMVIFDAMTVPFRNYRKLSNSFIGLLTAITALATLTGCPYSSVYHLDEQPQYQVDEACLGKWATMVTDETGRKSPVKTILSKKNDYEYEVIFTGYLGELNQCGIAINDTIRSTAYISIIDSRRFLMIRVKEENYIAEFIYDDDKISILPLCEHFTNRIVKSNRSLQKAIEMHFKTRLYPLYDEPFCLRNMVRVN